MWGQVPFCSHCLRFGPFFLDLAPIANRRICFLLKNCKQKLIVESNDVVDSLIAFAQMFEFVLNIFFENEVVKLTYFYYYNVCIVSFISELPTTKPTLWTERDRYEPGEILVANCSSPPSQPRVELKLSINNMVVSGTFSISNYSKTASLHSSSLAMSNFWFE